MTVERECAKCGGDVVEAADSRVEHGFRPWPATRQIELGLGATTKWQCQKCDQRFTLCTLGRGVFLSASASLLLGLALWLLVTPETARRPRAFALVLAALFGVLGLIVTTKMVVRLYHRHRNPPRSEA